MRWGPFSFDFPKKKKAPIKVHSRSLILSFSPLLSSLFSLLLSSSFFLIQAERFANQRTARITSVVKRSSSHMKELQDLDDSSLPHGWERGLTVDGFAYYIEYVPCFLDFSFLTYAQALPSDHLSTTFFPS